MGQNVSKKEAGSTIATFVLQLDLKLSDINFSQESLEETGPSAMSERLRGESILVNVPEDNENVCFCPE